MKTTLNNIHLSIIKSIRNCLYRNLDFKVEVTDYYIKEPILRPSLKLHLTKYKRNVTGQFIKSRKLDYSVYFFARSIENTRTDNYAVQEILADLFFKGIKFNDSFLIEILDSEFLETDGVLIGTFSFEIYEDLKEELFIDNSELIEELKFKRR